MKKKLRILISAILVVLYVYILGSGFFVGAFAIQGDKGTQYIILYALLSVAFPVLVCIMYHRIKKLEAKIDMLEKEIDDLRK